MESVNIKELNEKIQKRQKFQNQQSKKTMIQLKKIMKLLMR